MKISTARAMLFAGGSILCLAASAAGAQTAAPQAVAQGGAAGDDGKEDAEIIITANKLSQNVQDVPKSVQVVSSDALARQNIVGIGDLQKLVPTIAGVGQTLAIRGVGTGASNIGSQNKVGIVLDDVPQASRATLANNLQDVERVEVLPGPQGTLAGRNATGGLINIVTRGPSDTWTGFINVLGTSDVERQLAGFIAGPINDKIQISMSQYYRGFRGLYKNIALDQWADETVIGTRNKIKLLPTEGLTIEGSIFYQYQKNNARGGQGGGPGGGNPPIFRAAPPINFKAQQDVRPGNIPFSTYQPGVTPGPDNIFFSSPRNGTSVTTSYGANGRVEYETPGGLILTSITSYFDEIGRTRTDYFAAQVDIPNQNMRPDFDGFVNIVNATDMFNQEFRINSPTSGPFHYVAGLFYSYMNQAYDYQRFFQPVDWLRDFTTKSYSAYAHADYDVTEKLKLQGGLRFERDNISYDWVFLPILAAQKVTSDGVVRNFPLINPLIRSSGADTASYLNYDVGAQYQVNDDVMVYATYARAQQGPIYDAEDNLNSNGPTPALNTSGVGGRLQPLAQERVTSFEAGVKSQLFDRRLTLNVSVFQSNFTNYQVLTNLINPDPNLPPTLKVESVGKVRTRGLEANVSGRITDNLRANLNLAYTEAKILDFPNAPCYGGAVVGGPDCTTINPGTPRAFNTQGNLSGQLLNRAPRVRFTYSMDYGLPIGSGESQFFVAPLVKYASNQRTDLLGQPGSLQGVSVIVDANVGIRNPSFTAELFVRNLFENSIETFGITATGFVPNNQVVNRQLDRNNFRHVGARFRYNF